MSKPLYQIIASKLVAYNNCANRAALGAEHNIWGERHFNALKAAVKEGMPSGSGFDNGTQIEIESSKKDKLVFLTSYHHMDANGFYDGWTEHQVIITPSFDGFDIRVTGRNRNEIKEYIEGAFYEALRKRYDESYDEATETYHYHGIID